MNQIRKLIEKILGPLSDDLWRIILAVIYWSAAVVVLLVVIFGVIKLTSPSSPASPTPDLTATLQQAILEALGPATATPVPSITPIPPDTPMPSITPIASLIPSITPSPLPTATPTSTPLLPTLTPALPADTNEAFQLKPLSAQDYDHLITLMEVFPELLPDRDENDAYYTSFFYAMLANYEALLHYPKNPLAEGWRWRLANHLNQIGDQRTSIHYANLISQGLNNQGLALEDLPSWIQLGDPNLSLAVLNVNPIGVNITNRVLEIQTPGGSIYLWLVDDGNQYKVYALADETNYQSHLPSEVIWGDINDDQWQEIIIFTPRSEGRNLDFPRVFNLAQNPPEELFFRRDQKFRIGLENEYDWKVTRNDAGYNDLQLTATVYPPCLLDIEQTYTWMDGWIVRRDESYQIQPISELLGYCELLVDQASAIWGYPAAIEIMEQLLPDWPPPPTPEKTYPLDSADEWRFRLGVYQALAGNTSGARSYLNQILQSPIVPRSRWVTAAGKFIAGLDSPKAFYKACLDTTYCNPRLALAYWIASLSPEEAPYALYHLSGGGASIRYTGSFDFEGDDFPERWFTIRHHPMDRLEFWVLTEGTQGPQGLFVTTVEYNNPNLIRYTDYDGLAYVWIDAEQSFRLVRGPDPLEVSIELLAPTYYFTALTNQVSTNALKSLLTGFSPDTILAELQTYLESSSFTCMNKDDCARFYYALGLAAELSGNEALAIDYYLKIWWDSFESPFSTLVRLKLAYKPGYEPTPTITPSPTITLTPTISPTPTITSPPTLTPTATSTGPTPTASSTPTATSTSTATSTPTATNTQDPNNTNTPTATATATSDSYP